MTIVSFAALAALAIPGGPAHAQDLGIPVGSTAPTITLNDTQGKAVNLADVIGKKVVVLEFWATWCANCKELEPKMLAAHRKYGAEVAFYGVAVPINQSLERVTRYVQEHKYPFTMLWDKDGEYAAAFEVPATSFVAIIDKAGKVAYTNLGPHQDLDAAIAKLR